MKNYIKQSIALICAVYFLIAGSGYNIVRYCCDGCAQEGIEAVASKSCETIHHEHKHDGTDCCHHSSQQQNEKDDLACSDVNHQTDGCHLLRIQTDTPSLDVANIVMDMDQELIMDISFSVLSLLLENIPAEKLAFTPPDNVPLFSGRDILAYHAVLLI